MAEEENIMTITLPPDLEAALQERAQQLVAPIEMIAVSALREKFPRPRPPLEPRDDWERLELGLGIDCGTSVSNEALSSEGLYE
jgi:predicted transcriptional regulator